MATIPTVGRIVYFRASRQAAEPLAAIVTAVLSDSVVNLHVLGQDGSPIADYGREVPLVQEGEEIPNGPYCHWMPYQIAAAAKAEAAEAIAVENKTAADPATPATVTASDAPKTDTPPVGAA